VPITSVVETNEELMARYRSAVRKFYMSKKAELK
jgi:hypothetical protein